MTLTEFLLARIAEDEAEARAVYRADSWHVDFGDWREDRTELVGGGKILADFTDEDRMVPHHVIRWNPARALGECVAKRQAIEEHRPGAAGVLESLEPARHVCSTCRGARTSDGGRFAIAWPCPTLRAIAAIYADHPDYREEWL